MSADAALPAALRRHATNLEALAAVDFDRLSGVIEWLRAHPASGLYVRQLPIRGIDSKWIERHAAPVRDLLAAVAGPGEDQNGMGLARVPSRLRIRLLDSTLAPGCPADVEAPIDQLAALDLAPSRAIVVENLQTLLALPSAPGTVAIFGRGFAVSDLSLVP